MPITLSNPKASISSGAIIVTEIDGSPINQNISTLKFSNDSVTDNGDGTATIVTGVGGGGDVSSNTGVSVDGEVVLFSGVGGKTLKRSGLTGLLKSVSGVLQSATPGTDYSGITSGTSILKGNGVGGFSLALAGTDYLAINGDGSQLTSLTKSQVGLGNADNTSDVNKPISTAAQTALDLKAPLASPSFTGNLRSTLAGTENFIIDASQDPRQITLGVFRIEHKAGIPGTRPITLNIDSNGFGNTRAMVVNYLASGMADGDESHLYEIVLDTDGSTGGEAQGLSVAKTGTGLVHVTAIEALADVNVVIQRTGDPITLTQAWKLSGSTYTDTTVDFSNGSNIEIFSLDNDYIICGSDAVFTQLDIELFTESSHTIDSVFQYSTGVGTWNTFQPADGSNGFTKSGSVMWPALAGWVAASVNGVSKYYIRIQRTRNLVTTPPVESNIRVRSTTEFKWDKNGDVSIRKLKAIGLPTYIDRASAQTGGLVTGEFYQKTDGTLMVV